MDDLLSQVGIHLETNDSSRWFFYVYKFTKMYTTGLFTSHNGPKVGSFLFLKGGEKSI
jgi:hypothetical protein